MNRTALSTGSTSRRLPALLFVLLLALVAQTSGRPSSEDDLAIIPPDADNVEIHKVKFVNGVMQKDHPVIMYKEDFVSEDYDPTKNESSPVRHKKHKRTHHHREEPQQENDGDQILFDILPDKPIVLEEDLKAPLVNPIEVAELAEPVKKEAAGKHPKKYHSRQRRQAYLPTYPNEYVLQYYYSTPQKQNVPALIYFKRYQVQGKKPNLKGPPNRLDQTSVVVENRGEFDLIHNSDQSLANFSIYNISTTTTRRPIHDLVPLGGFSPPGFAQPESRPAPAPASRPRRPSSRTDGFHFPQDFGYQENSICQRASKICCSQRNIGSQYECFHHHGCNENISTIISTCS
ncbi:uncharacterized protein LOC108031607 isoform X3 [Drosophila biarmipes]|uniref:uncharacterized protein LOC108031607 isoform X3 n=1 Tax=Drosophila biarmipes TaxID=125945 RepID=UPI0007E76943|nr:uncharacterized protein LOC108031607 isoform X3 [Drosophila biarmipes]